MCKSVVLVSQAWTINDFSGDGHHFVDDKLLQNAGGEKRLYFPTFYRSMAVASSSDQTTYHGINLCFGSNWHVFWICVVTLTKVNVTKIEIVRDLDLVASIICCIEAGL